MRRSSGNVLCAVNQLNAPTEYVNANNFDGRVSADMGAQKPIQQVQAHG